MFISVLLRWKMVAFDAASRNGLETSFHFWLELLLMPIRGRYRRWTSKCDETEAKEKIRKKQTSRSPRANWPVSSAGTPSIFTQTTPFLANDYYRAPWWLRVNRETSRSITPVILQRPLVWLSALLHRRSNAAEVSIRSKTNESLGHRMLPRLLFRVLQLVAPERSDARTGRKGYSFKLSGLLLRIC